jgi:hypothetical protein
MGEDWKTKQTRMLLYGEYLSKEALEAFWRLKNR